MHTQLRATATRHAALIAICAAYLILGVTYSLVTPRFEASDELWHYPMVDYLARNGLQLPPQQPGVATAWRQEGSQPPLYYMLAALLTQGIDTSDLDRVRRVNPHADIGLVRPDGNVNMMIHRPELDGWQPAGAALALQVARLFSIALGLATVVVTYGLARTALPEYRSVAIIAAALNAFLPMFLFISGSVNNDNLSNLLGNLITWLIVIVLRCESKPRLRLYVLIGVATGAGLLSKLNIGFLIPIIALSFVIVSVRFRSLAPLLLGGLISGGLTIAIAGWWYLRNYQLYGDPTGLNVFLDIVGRRAIPANAAQLWAERHSFTQAFWGFFGGVNVPMPEWVYLVFNVIGVIGLTGAALFLLFQMARRRWTTPQWLTIAVIAVWPLATFLSYLRWTAETPASQGRLIFGALSPILIWMGVGWTWWLPRRVRDVGAGGVVAWFAIVAVAVPFLIIAPAYARPPLVAPPAAATNGPTFIAPDSGAITLLTGAVRETAVTPGTYVNLDTTWLVTETFARDWSLFVHLVTPDNVILAQRDIYPGGGTLATSDIAAGLSWENHVAVFVPDTALAPMTLDVIVGWYHLPTSDRLRLDHGDEMVTIGSVELVPRPSAFAVPNPLSVNFDGQIELLGYAISDISPPAGSEFTVSLYWRGLRPVERDYVVFAHLIDPTTQTIYAGSDAQPAGWTRPTSSWTPGDIIEDIHTLTVRADTPPAIYEFEIGLYQQLETGFPRLRIVTPDGGMANDYIYLTRLRVMPGETSE